MSENWKPGDVAMVHGDVCIYLGRGRGWEHGDERRFAHNESNSPARRLVVIDPAALSMDDLLRAVGRWHDWSSLTHERAAIKALFDTITEQTSPSKPEEPQGLGAVVEDAEGQRWVRAGITHRKADDWRCVESDMVGYWAAWADVKAVRVLSEGVTP